MKTKKKKRLSGSECLKAVGKTAVMVGLTAEQLERIDKARAIEGRTRANFVGHHADEVAKKIING